MWALQAVHATPSQWRVPPFLPLRAPPSLFHRTLPPCLFFCVLFFCDISVKQTVEEGVYCRVALCPCNMKSGRPLLSFSFRNACVCSGRQANKARNPPTGLVEAARRTKFETESPIMLKLEEHQNRKREGQKNAVRHYTACAPLGPLGSPPFP